VTSEELQTALAASLKRRLSDFDSLEYSLTWKHSIMPVVGQICRLRASGRRTGGSGFSGVPTPVAQPANGTPEDFLRRKRESVARGSRMGICLTDLQMVAKLAGAPTPAGRDWRDGHSNQHGKNARPLNEVAMLAGSLTPTGEDHKLDGPKTLAEYDNALIQGKPVRQSAQRLRNQAMLAGSATPNTMDILPGGKNLDSRKTKGGCVNLKDQTLGATGWPSPTPTASTGALNPEFSRWLMGFPEAWAKAIPDHADWKAWQKLAQASAERNATERSQSQDTATQ